MYEIDAVNKRMARIVSQRRVECRVEVCYHGYASASAGARARVSAYLLSVTSTDSCLRQPNAYGYH